MRMWKLNLSSLSEPGEMHETLFSRYEAIDGVGFEIYDPSIEQKRRIRDWIRRESRANCEWFCEYVEDDDEDGRLVCEMIVLFSDERDADRFDDDWLDECDDDDDDSSYTDTDATNIY